MNQTYQISSNISDINASTGFEYRKKELFEKDWNLRLVGAIIITLGYIVGVAFLHPYLDHGVSAFAIIPVSYISWLYGKKGGVVASLGAFALNPMICTFLGHYWLESPIWMIAGNSLILYNALLIGHLSELNNEVRNKLDYSIKMENKLLSNEEQLKRSNKELEEFAYIASHDLQEPLRMVVSYLQLLERRYETILDSEAKEFIDYAVDGATRMQGLINDLLMYSRVGTKGKELKLEDSGMILEQALVNLKMSIDENNATITYSDLPMVMADENQLCQLFQNLVRNAIKFHGEELPRIHILAQENGTEWIFSVKDNGIGIDPEYEDRIFTIFQRLHGRNDYPGTGIGLAVCKKIVERHGGRIWVESEPGKGSTFYFTILMKGCGESPPSK